MEMVLSPGCVCRGMRICWLMECGWDGFGSDAGHLRAVWAVAGRCLCVREVPDVGWGCTLVRVGVPGVDMNKLGTQGQQNCPCSALPKGMKVLIQAFKLSLERNSVFCLCCNDLWLHQHVLNRCRGWCVGRPCTNLH